MPNSVLEDSMPFAEQQELSVVSRCAEQKRNAFCKMVEEGELDKIKEIMATEPQARGYIDTDILMIALTRTHHIEMMRYLLGIADQKGILTEHNNRVLIAIIGCHHVELFNEVLNNTAVQQTLQEGQGLMDCIREAVSANTDVFLEALILLVPCERRKETLTHQLDRAIETMRTDDTAVATFILKHIDGVELTFEQVEHLPYLMQKMERDVHDQLEASVDVDAVYDVIQGRLNLLKQLLAFPPLLKHIESCALTMSNNIVEKCMVDYLVENENAEDLMTKQLEIFYLILKRMLRKNSKLKDSVYDTDQELRRNCIEVLLSFHQLRQFESERHEIAAVVEEDDLEGQVYLQRLLEEPLIDDVSEQDSNDPDSSDDEGSAYPGVFFSDRGRRGGDCNGPRRGWSC
ncbi:MAG: hypothetical protein NTW08_04995 [Gammaproteobacteria bacterium]|nr:hypothetical protein [Gammaproteobacteria bacterium]